MRVLNIKAEGTTDDDLILAVEEVLSRLKGGNVQGFDRNETGSFTFEVNGIEEER